MKPTDILPDAPENAVIPPTDDSDGVWRDVNLSAWEYARICELLGRRPNSLELELFGVMWSEHCSYKNTRALLRRLPVDGPRVVQGPGENAGAIRVGWRTIVFKIESHNHPSFIAPFHGAATGVGGILRDIFTMGARPVAVLDSMRFGKLDEARQRELLDGARAGVADYARGMGVPAVATEIRFDESYRTNCLVNAMAVGVADGPLAKGLAAGPGNPVLVFGRPTGRDGVRSASFASRELESTAPASPDSSDVPVIPEGNPEVGRRVMRATLELLQTGAVAGMQDMGAAGFTSSACEMAARAGTGIEIDVRRVPKVDETVQPFEVMLSETQERMLAVVHQGQESLVTDILDKYGLTYGICGVVTDDGMVRVRDGQTVLAEVPAHLLADEAPCYVRPLEAPPERVDSVEDLMSSLPEPDDYGAVLDAMLGSPTVVTGRLSDVSGAGDEAGKLGAQLVPGAAVIDLRAGEGGNADADAAGYVDDELAIAVTTYGNGRHVFLEPYMGTQGCVAAAARRVAATGAMPVAVTNGLNFGNPEKPHTYWQLERSLTGMADACRALDTPVTGGNASLFNETDGQAVHPTPIIGMVGVLPAADKGLPTGFQQAGNAVMLLGNDGAELGGSEYAAVWHGVVAGPPPSVDLKAEKQLYTLMRQLANYGLPVAAHAVTDGGLAVALAEMAMAAAPGAAGCHVTVDTVRTEDGGPVPSAALFSESHGRIIIEAPIHAAGTIAELAGAAGVPCRVLGRVADGDVRIHGSDGEPLIVRSTAHLASRRREAIP